MLFEEGTMNRPVWLFVFALGILLILAVSPGILAADHAFVGADKCKMCHNSPAKGAQYTKWKESSHSKAFEVLGSDEAKKIAQEKGIADPQKADECLKCHVTGHGTAAELLTGKYKATDGVACESCHGAGGDYWKMSVMKDPAQSGAKGLIIPNEKTCTACHNAESPTFKSFDFASASTKIAHPNPKATAK